MNLFKNKIQAGIISSAAIIAVASFISRVLGLVRSRIFSHMFGAGDEIDIYVAAFRIPDLIFSLLLLGALSAAFIPVFTEYITKNKKEDAWKIVNSILNISLIGLFVGCILAFIFAPQLMDLIAPGFDAQKKEIATTMTRIMLLSPVFLILSNIASGILNSFKRFVVYSLAPILYNLGIIFGALFLTERFGIYGLAIGVVIGAFLHLLIQVPSTIKLGFRYKAVINLKHPGIKKIVRLMIPRTFGLAVSQVNLLISTIVGSTLAVGSVAIYDYANNLQSFPVGIIGVSFAIACFPSLAEAFTRNDSSNFVKYFSRTFRQILFFIIPLSVIILLLRAQIVRIILGTGAFDWSDTRLTAMCLGFFSISLFAQSLSPLLARSFFSIQNTKTPLFISIFAMVVNVIGCVVLAQFMGVAGLALAFSISMICEMILLLIFFRVRIGYLDDANLISSGLKIGIASIIAGFALYGSLYGLNIFLDTHTFIGIFLQTAGAFVVGVIVYFLLSLLFKIKEVRVVTRLFARNFKD